METCGQGFSLPIEESESITKVISLYRTWALEPSKRPTPINDNPQFFLQVSQVIIFCYFFFFFFFFFFMLISVFLNIIL